MRDKLPSRPFAKESGVLNFDDDAGPGTHWVAWVKDRQSKIYFDSYGADPPLELQRYLGQNILLSTDKLQPYGTNFCGQLCVYVIKRLVRTGSDYYSVINDIRRNKWKASPNHTSLK